MTEVKDLSVADYMKYLDIAIIKMEQYCFTRMGKLKESVDYYDKRAACGYLDEKFLDDWRAANVAMINSEIDVLKAGYAWRDTARKEEGADDPVAARDASIKAGAVYASKSHASDAIFYHMNGTHITAFQIVRAAVAKSNYLVIPETM